MEDGYFTRVVIPQALGGRAVRLCPPVGLHPALPALIEAQAVAACESLTIRPDAASVLLIGHGSASAPGRHLALHDHAASLAKGGRFAQVEAACLEEPPFTADTLARLSGRPVIAIGYFANLGGHVQDDVQALVAAERSARGSEGRLVHFAGNVTDAPAMIGVILDQAGFSGAEGK
jgi:sirohydrochlorin cobaltochelatase